MYKAAMEKYLASSVADGLAMRDHHTLSIANSSMRFQGRHLALGKMTHNANKNISFFMMMPAL